MQVSGHKTEKSFRRYLQLYGYESALKLKEMWGGCDFLDKNITPYLKDIHFIEIVNIVGEV